MKKEKQIFVINLRIKENNQEVKELREKANLEITWQENKGILNPGELRTFTDENGIHSYRKSKGEVVEFEKEGKKYKILVKINEIKKGWFKDKITELGGISPAPGSNFIIVEDNKERKEESSRRWNEEDPNQKIKPTKRRWSGYILGGILFSFLLIIVVIYCWQNKEK